MESDSRTSKVLDVSESEIEVADAELAARLSEIVLIPGLCTGVTLDLLLVELWVLFRVMVVDE